MSNGKRVWLYARFSPRPDAENAQSVDQQLHAMREWAAREGHEIAGEFFDKGVSGSKGMKDLDRLNRERAINEELDRPGLFELLTSIGPGEMLVVTKLDRLARNALMADLVEKHLSGRKARLWSLAGEGTWELGDEDWLQRKLLLVIADYQRRLGANRTSASLVWRQRNGRAAGGDPPYGYRKEGKLLFPDEKEQEVLRKIEQLRKAGMGSVLIARTLEQAGYRSRKRNGWRRKQIECILKRIDSGLMPKDWYAGRQGAVA